jgi:hypothetical protein
VEAAINVLRIEFTPIVPGVNLSAQCLMNTYNGMRWVAVWLKCCQHLAQYLHHRSLRHQGRVAHLEMRGI